MTTSDLVYPAIVLGKQGIVQVVLDEDTLTTHTAAALKSGWFGSLLIVDCEGRAAKVKEARFVSGRGSFWGYTWLLDRIIRIELSLVENPTPVTLGDLKQRILKRMGIDGRSMPDEQQWQERTKEVTAAQSFSELAEMLLPLYDARTLFQRLKKL